MSQRSRGFMLYHQCGESTDDNEQHIVLSRGRKYKHDHKCQMDNKKLQCSTNKVITQFDTYY